MDAKRYKHFKGNEYVVVGVDINTKRSLERLLETFQRSTRQTREIAARQTITRRTRWLLRLTHPKLYQQLFVPVGCRIARAQQQIAVAE